MSIEKILRNVELFQPTEIVHKSEKEEIINKIIFSASGQAKFTILKNDISLGVIFNSSHLSYYPFSVDLKPGDVLRFVFENRDYPMDMYLNYEVEQK